MKFVFTLLSLLGLPVLATAAELTTLTAPAAPPSAPPFERPQLKWSGDLRVRGQNEKDGDKQARATGRLRARFGVTAKLNSELKAEIRLATTKANRSTNQTLGDSSEPGGQRHYVGLDRAYAEWQPVSFARFLYGRFPQLHYRPGESQILLDEDIVLEGGGLALDYEFAEGFKVFANAGSSFIRENYDDYYTLEDTDNMINFGQLGVRWQRERNWITLGGGFYNFVGVQGREFSNLVKNGTRSGNTEALVAGQVKNPYLPKEIFVDSRAALGALDVGPFVQFVENRETRDPNWALWSGVYIGQTTWDAQVAYAEVKSDAVMGLFTDSDFGAGNTDVRGWVASARWKFYKGMTAKLTQYINRTAAASESPKEYNRTHADLTISF